MKWLIEHFIDLLYNPSVINENVIHNLLQKDIILKIMNHSTVDEALPKMIKEFNIGKAPGLDSSPIEILLYGGDKLTAEIHLI